MSFLAPWALAWAAASSAVVVLYMLRRRERQVHVSALFLWEEIPPDALSRFARWLPRADLLLWAQIAIVLLLALALAAPVLVRQRPAGATAVVVDTSITLAPEGRLEQAREAARDFIRGSAGPWLLVAWGDPPEVVVGPTERGEEVYAAINRLSYSLSTRPPLSRALALVPQGWDRVVVISGAPPVEAQTEIVVLPPVDNLAIVDFAVRSQPDGSGYQALVSVHNDTGEYRDVVVTVRDIAGGQAFQQARLLPPETTDVFLFPLWGFVGPAYAAELLPEDDFLYDNIRYYALDMPSALRVRWIGQEDRYLWAGLQAAARAERAELPPWDLTVVVGETLESPVEGPCLLVEGGTTEAPRGSLVPAGPWTAEEDVLLEHVDISPWAISSLYELSLPDDAKVPLSSGGVPALARWETPQGRRVALTAQLARSNLPLTVGFPVLLRNAIAWLVPGADGTAVTVGTSMALPGETVVRTPAGNVDTVWVPKEPGLYELHDGNRWRYVAANVPRVSLTGETDATSPQSQVAPQEVPMWPWVAGLALVLLGGEWYLATRRGV